MFEGDVEMQVALDMRNKTGSAGDYGEAEFDTIVTGTLAGASGKHKRLYHDHDELQEQEGFLNILYEGDGPDAVATKKIKQGNNKFHLFLQAKLK